MHKFFLQLKRNSKVIFTLLVLSYAVYGVLYTLKDTRVLSEVGYLVNDRFTYQKLYQKNPHDNEIVIVRIDDKTLDAFGRSDIGVLAFDKGVHAQVIENIFEIYGASVVGSDIVYANPSILGEEDEKVLGDVLNTYHGQVVIATRSDKNPHPLCLYADISHGFSDISSQNRVRKFDIEDPYYDIIEVCPDSMGNNKGILSFGREVLGKYLQGLSPLRREEIEYKLRDFHSGDIKNHYIAYYHNGSHNIGTYGYTSYSFADIYNGESVTGQGEKIDLQDKIVLIGEVGTILHDRQFTPAMRNTLMPGVEIQANIIQTLKNGAMLQDFGAVNTFFTYIIFQSLLLISIFLFSFFTSFLILIIFIITLTLFGATLFTYNILFDIFFITGVLGVNYFIVFTYKYFITDARRRHLKKHFSLYVSPDLVDEISTTSSPEFLKGEEKELSIYFSDIENFTTLSESVGSQQIVAILNEYFHEMTIIIHNNFGTLDKYIGDAVMCFFNAPLDISEHSYYACKTALEQKQKLSDLNSLWKEKYSNWDEDIFIRIGIHTGNAIHGNIGSSLSRVNYTIIGDSVNLASRLESVGKKYGVSICVSGEVYEREKEVFYFRKLDSNVLLKGKKAPTSLYELICFWDDTEKKEKFYQIHNNYDLGLHAYDLGEYNTAIEYFSKNTEDTTSIYMLQRCKDILEGRIKLNQGIFMMDEK
ncbi:adenylate/guanylate cyclase domain-containing protein [Candidatus Gracilibacteria bacterium]|nr:adenylate/guanylate cyclase domain-containing protein [Candidatus Gracilibacteria bacterium]